MSEVSHPVTRISVVIAAYNEARTIEECVTRVAAKRPLGLPVEVIVVEGKSTDGTREIVQRLEKTLAIRAIYEEKPRGKGLAVRTGLSHVTGDIIIIQDGDLEYSADDYEKLVSPIVEGKTLFVLGSRVLGTSRQNFRRFNKHPIRTVFFNVGGAAVNSLFNILYGTHLTDQATMFKVFHRDAIQNLKFVTDSWDFDPELLAKLVLAGHVPIEVPVQYRARGPAEGKKIRLRDVLIVVKAMIRFRFNPSYGCSNASSVRENPL